MTTALKIIPAIAAALALTTPQISTVYAGETANIPDIENRLPEDEIIYFLLPDRFENGDPANDRGTIGGDRLDHGFDPTDKGFYHGGDIRGLINRLDYIQGLGVTAIWLAPIFHNKAVQGSAGKESAGYHGYWVVDFLNIDPHFGTREDFRHLVDATHARGMKVYMDIITNHTADVIKYAECHGKNAPSAYRESQNCPYRSQGDFPYTTLGDRSGPPINEGFLAKLQIPQTPQSQQPAGNFAGLTNPNFAYTPYVDVAEAKIKNPPWLNDLTLYNNRGDTFWEGESAVLGDFAGLDDLMTTHPRVVDGFIEIYKQWITDFGIDGFRIDTAKHVDPEFWQKFTPAILDHAKSQGIANFHIFGEVYEFEPAQLARFTTYAGLPTVLDFAFQGEIRNMVANGGPSKNVARLFAADTVYAAGHNTARQLPIFLGNHDMGRFAMFVKQAKPEISEEDLLSRVKLGHAVMMFSRGVPTIYYGDEQGFISDGNDQGARESMFASKVASYLDNDLIGTDATVGDANFDRHHPLYLAISSMAKLRQAEPAIRRGPLIVRHSSHEDGLLVISRLGTDNQSEIVIAFNANEEDRKIAFPVDGRATKWNALYGICPASSAARGSYELTIGRLDYVICKSEF